jgi:hypothetical protein
MAKLSNQSTKPTRSPSHHQRLLLRSLRLSRRLHTLRTAPLLLQSRSHVQKSTPAYHSSEPQAPGSPKCHHLPTRCLKFQSFPTFPSANHRPFSNGTIVRNHTTLSFYHAKPTGSVHSKGKPSSNHVGSSGFVTSTSAGVHGSGYGYGNWTGRG